ncbi:MAG: WbqC family protein [Alistipes sp.]
MTILPLAYLGSVEYFAHLLREECIIDLHEHFIKRSERNRTQILSANGVMDLTVQVCRANRPHTPMCDVRIDYSKRWQHQHWVSILSAYKSSPYFDYFFEQFEPFYRKEYPFLADYDLELTHTLLRVFGIPCEPRLSEQYVVAGEGDVDLRPKTKKDSTFAAEPYFQVFADRMPFVPNLSALDLLFAEGPNSASVLRCCQL